MNVREKYIELIKSAKKRNHFKQRGDGYEMHHIMPRSLFPLWAKRKTNLIALTRDEHVLAHQYLMEIFPSRSMTMAYMYMQHQPETKIQQEATKNLWKNKKYRQKVVESNLKSWSQDDKRKKHSELRKKWFLDHPEQVDEQVKKLKKVVCQRVRNIETGIVFESMKEAGEWANCKSYCKIGMCCRKERLHAGKTPDGRPASWEYVGFSERTIRNMVTVKDKFEPEKRGKTSKRFWTNGTENKIAEVCPGEGWHLGMTHNGNIANKNKKGA